MTKIEDTPPRTRPNGLKAADDGLWVISGGDSRLYKPDY